MSPRSPRNFRTLKHLSLAIFAAVGLSPAWAQTAPSNPTGPTLILTGPATATPPRTPATTPAPTPATAPAAVIVPAPGPAATAAPAAEAPFTQAFVASITGDKVYVRSGPDQKYYEIGQLVKGDLVYVVGASGGWYLVLPPNGAFCMLSKEFVEPDAGGATGTLKGDYVNVHAGSAIYPNADPYAVLPPSLRKGAKVKILGSTDKYFEIAPPETAYFFVSAQYVKAAPGTAYKVAQLKLPAGATGPAGVTVEAPTTMPAVAVLAPGMGPELPGAAGQPLPVLVPKVTYSETATAKFNDANARYQEEGRKPPAQQNVEGLLAEFKAILALENLSPSVKAGAQADIAAIERTLTVQRLVIEQAVVTDATKRESEALRAQYDAAEKAIAAAREAGPYNAEGLLQSSTIVAGKYALVNPQTGRVVAYVDPASAAVDIGTLVGKYVGVRGISKKMEGSEVTVIQVNNATLMPQPK
jgi:uncharacterized protein YgiM (DUF1202 family)